jgi:hypothetical protein
MMPSSAVRPFFRRIGTTSVPGTAISPLLLQRMGCMGWGNSTTTEPVAVARRCVEASSRIRGTLFA